MRVFGVFVLMPGFAILYFLVSARRLRVGLLYVGGLMALTIAVRALGIAVDGTHVYWANGGNPGTIMKGTKHLEAARKLADWSASKSANEQYAKNFAVVAYPGVAAPIPGIPGNYEDLLIKQDLNWSAQHRDQILAEWTKRYDGKSEPKQ
jgi:ABC-type Fe3+ transport system substrate-binding protein